MVSIVTLLYLSLNLISSKANEIDDHRSAMSVQGAIQTSVNRVWALVIDNAVWDDAVTELYKPKLDISWVHSTWGAGFKVNNLYDGTFVLDQNFNVLWGSFLGRNYTGKDLSLLGNGYAELVRRNAKSLAADKIIYAGITKTNEGVAFVGIGLVRPMTGRLQVHDATRRYLVITRHLNTRMLNELGNTFQIADLRFVANSAGESSVPLKSAAGENLGYLSWDPRLPGAEAAKAASGDIARIAMLAAGLILIFIAISGFGLYKLAKGEKQARKIALTDWLSHLPNRRALIERLNKFSRRGDKGEISVVFIDLDGFKDINDIYGHDTGDKLIVTLAKTLRQQVPENGMLVRMGGDEFALMLGGERAGEKSAAFANQVLAFLTAPICLDERTIHISASIGIASGTLVDCPSSELFRRADIAMYHSKITGKGRVTWYDSALNSVREHQLIIENDIRDGLEREEFEVWYQPIVDAKTQVMISVEALVRWPRRPQGELPPEEFIGIAETSGLIYSLGQFVLRRACQDLQPLGELRLSVNISPAQFRDPEFEAKVAGVLSETGFPAQRLELEVTESYVLENPDRAIAAIDNLKNLGTSMALDDFGTGYSSIGYLRRFNFDTIKIDKSLAGLVDTDDQAAALVSGTVRIAGALGMRVTAEGVENSNQMRLLRLAGCDRLQGFYFSRPMPINDLLKLREQRQC